MDKVITVSQLNTYISGAMGYDPILSNLRLQGEISNFRVTNSGHAYFALKDAYSLINCICFCSHFENLSFFPENGQKILAKGYVSIYSKSGQLQFYAQYMQQDGTGILHQRFELLKIKLEAQGYFEPGRKRKLPEHPRKISVISSRTGAVIHDIQNIVWRRNPSQRLLLIPVIVQGEGACIEIANAINILQNIEEVDIIILARGGGSLEDLWAFNEEIVADAIYHSSIPIVSAVGHETDFSISDFVADLRASTPSAAAELCTTHQEKYLTQLKNIYGRIVHALRSQVNDFYKILDKIENNSIFIKPRRIIEPEIQKLNLLQERLFNNMKNIFSKSANQWELLNVRIESAGPESALKRGYALIKANKNIIKNANDVKIGDKIKIILSNGELEAEISSIS